MTFSGDINNGLVDGLVARYAGDSPNKHCAALLTRFGWHRDSSIVSNAGRFGLNPQGHRPAP